MQQGANYAIDEEMDCEYEGKLPYYFSPSITKTRTVNGKSYKVRSYFIGGKDFQETVKQLAVKQAYKKAG